MMAAAVPTAWSQEASPAAPPQEPQPQAEPHTEPQAAPEAEPAAAPPAPEMAAAAGPLTGLPADNLIQNGSFEAGRDPWFSLEKRNTDAWAPFSVVNDFAVDGGASALLDLDNTQSTYPTRVYGVIQELASQETPAYVSGWYRVEGWQRGTAKQYLQVVLISMQPENIPPTARVPNVQVAYALAGVAAAPLNISNRRFVITGPPEPVEGEWQFFEIDVRKIFQDAWGQVPERSRVFRMLFEVRYDNRAATDPPSKAKVYYDSLYAGPTSRLPAAP